jgi:hypothetical protein
MLSPFFLDVEDLQCKTEISACLTPFLWFAFLDALFLRDCFLQD